VTLFVLKTPALQVFDALVVCNGHYSEPNLPEVPGADQWPGLQMHRSGPTTCAVQHVCWDGIVILC
jgi:hypothetical protein